MKKSLLIIVAVGVLVGGLLLLTRSQRDDSTSARKQANSSNSSQDTSHLNPAQHSRVPAYQTVAETRALPPTLEPAKFGGKSREAYKAAKKIPQTLAQLPCYCHCDQSFGHKSLHSCFEDAHASQCAVCVDEALLAYRLEKEQRLTPEQVRKIIIEKYSAEN